MTRTVWVSAMVVALCGSLAHVNAETIRGKVVNAAGKALEGVTVSARDEAMQKTISVFSQADGSFKIDGLRDVKFNVRARLMGQLDEAQEAVAVGATLSFAMKPATGEDLEEQRTAARSTPIIIWRRSTPSWATRPCPAPSPPPASIHSSR